MENSTKNDGKVYGIHVKNTPEKDWNADDIIYAIAHEGSGGLSFTNFKHICEKHNKRYFFSKKANVDSDKSCSWVEICSALDDWNPELVLVESTNTFYDIARTAYDKAIFSDPVGLAKLDAIAERKKTGSRGSAASSMFFEPIESFKTTLQTTMDAASDLAANRSEINVEKFSQAGAQLAGLGPSGLEPGIGIIEEEIVDDDYWLNKSKEELGSMIDEYKNRCIMAEDKVGALLDVIVFEKNRKIAALEATVVSLKDELASAKQSRVSFMAEGDKAALELKKVGNGTAQDIIEGLKPFISGEMTALKNSLGSAVGMLESLKLVCCQLPDVKKGVDALVEEEACLQFASQERVLEYSR